MTVHVSLDLETWGTRPGCDIRSIGACVFNPVTGHIGNHIIKTVGDESKYRSATGILTQARTCDAFYIACDNPIAAMNIPDDKPIYRYPLHRDPQTVQWWNAPEQAAASTAFDNPVDLREALERFSHWLETVAGRGFYSPANQHVTNIRLWSHGPAFDPPILAEAYHAVGLPVPWHYRAPRDTRTLFDVAGIEDHSAWLRQHPGPMGVSHHALDDAICQARAVCAAWGMVAR